MKTNINNTRVSCFIFLALNPLKKCGIEIILGKEYIQYILSTNGRDCNTSEIRKATICIFKNILY